MPRLKGALLQALAGTAQAALGTWATQASQSTGVKKRRRKRQGGGCSPCEAMAKVDEAHKRVRNGTL